MKYKNIILFGPQGSGKGTQAGVISEKFGIPHISTGEIFRQEIKKSTALGKMTARIINDGNLMPDDITNKIVEGRLRGDDCQNGFVLEGYPRNLNQAKFLHDVTNIDLALEIWISDDEAVMRLGDRRTCPKCGAIYHLKFNPPKEAGVCDKCGKRLVIRDDDREEAVRARLKTYHEQTEPLVKFYKKEDVYRKIDGMPSIPEVTDAIIEIVEKKPFDWFFWFGGDLLVRIIEMILGK